VDLGGIDGLLHITDMSWGRVASPLDAVRPGEEVEVKILKVRPGKGAHISWAQSSFCPIPGPPWWNATWSAQSSPGKIMGLTDYGAFVELEPGIEAWCTSVK